MFKIIPFLVAILLISACKPAAEQGSTIEQNMALPQCIQSQSQCEIITELATVSIKFSQVQLSGNIKTELPFYLELTELAKVEDKTSQLNMSKQPGLTNVSAYLEGKDMFMGKIPVFFDEHKDGNKFLAQSLLASCTEEQMIWRLWVTIERSGKEQRFFIDFTSQRL